MSGFGGARKPGGFYDKRFNDAQDRTLHSGQSHGIRPDLSFKLKRSKQKLSTDYLRNLKLTFMGDMDENLVMSMDSDNDTRKVAILQGDTMNRREKLISTGPYIRRDGMKKKLYKPVSAMRQSDHFRTENPACGYRILIPYGHTFGREFILNSLRNLIAPETFVPIMYKVNSRFAVFYVDDERISEKLLDCDNRVTRADGFKMRVRRMPGFPRYELDDAFKNKMKEAIAKKYVPEMNALDLSRFHHNPDLVEDYYCSLTRLPILVTVLKIVIHAIPNLVEISLDNNQLHSLEKLNMLTLLPSLKILSICDNKIAEMDQLNSIKDLKLEELRLAGNPVTQTYNGRQDDFVSDIRSKFPSLLRFDGVALPAAIGFDLVNDRILLPPNQRLFSPCEKTREIAATFLQEYFRIFDSDNRQPLLDAYDDHAIFSMAVSPLHSVDNPYLTDSRNLCKVLDDSRRRKLLKQGRLPVVACISELPKMQHDVNSFTMDISLVTERMMIVTVTGIFKELESAHQPIRFFSRTFVIMPKGSGYCIINEMLQISKPTKKQKEEALRPSSSTTTTTTAATATAPVRTIPDDEKAQMTVALREQTKMTLEWTLMCLNDVQWDYNTALAAFQECHRRGDIPPDAFEK